MNRKNAIETIMAAVSSEDIIVATTGLISREIYEYHDSPRCLYVSGSMGLVSSIGLGLALGGCAHRIIVIDGDSSLLMNLGTMVTIAHHQPERLLHIVLDNGAYASCSEEASMSRTARFERIAVAVGYPSVADVSGQDELKRAILEFRNGPGFVLARIELGGRRDFLRPQNLAGIKDRFRTFLSETGMGDHHDV